MNPRSPSLNEIFVGAGLVPSLFGAAAPTHPGGDKPRPYEKALPS
jgi:hypothetical protein